MDFVWKTHLGQEQPFEPEYHQNPRLEIVSFVNQKPGTVLDIGCGGGATGKVIKEKFPGVRVIGIESNKQAAEHARQFLDKVVCSRIEDVDWHRDLDGSAIDTVFLLDVLEHLYDPWRALLKIKSWLQPGARVLASVPNIRNLAYLDKLASGDWEYTESGVLDITHIRFFTKKTFRTLFEQTGYLVRHMEPLVQPQFIDKCIVEQKPGRLVTKHISINTKDFSDIEELYALQHVIDAQVPHRGKQGNVCG